MTPCVLDEMTWPFQTPSELAYEIPTTKIGIGKLQPKLSLLLSALPAQTLRLDRPLPLSRASASLQ